MVSHPNYSINSEINLRKHSEDIAIPLRNSESEVQRLPSEFSNWSDHAEDIRKTDKEAGRSTEKKPTVTTSDSNDALELNSNPDQSLKLETWKEQPTNDSGRTLEVISRVSKSVKLND